ncbi:MAG: hypothetical protein ACJA2S_002415 [Cyclobacteriaceae bacterium]|jgi:hypothetical protein
MIHKISLPSIFVFLILLNPVQAKNQYIEIEYVQILNEGNKPEKVHFSYKKNYQFTVSYNENSKDSLRYNEENKQPRRKLTRQSVLK